MPIEIDKELSELTSKLGATTIPLNGVEFIGRGLKVNDVKDAEPIINAINNLEGPLEFLNLEGNTIGVPAAQAIAKALEDKPSLRQALWKDMFTGRMKTEIPVALKALSTGLMTAGARLEVLDLSDNASGPIGVDGIQDLLASEVCWGLKELRMANMGLGITGAKKLAAALQKCYDSSKAAGVPFSLKVFIGGRNRLENPGCMALSKVFMQIGTLEEIQIYQNGIYHEGFAMLSEALAHNQNLRVLNLNDNTITAEGASHLSKALKKLPNVTSLNLGDCLLRSEGAFQIADVLNGSLHRIEELVLTSNEISGDVGIAIAQALAGKQHLRQVYLGENCFGSKVQTIEDIIMTVHCTKPNFELNLEDDEGDEEEDDQEEETSEGEEDLNEEECDDDDYGEEDEEEEEEEDGDSEAYSGDDYPSTADTTSPMRRNYVPQIVDPPVSEPLIRLDLSSPNDCYEKIITKAEGLPTEDGIEELLKTIMYLSCKTRDKTSAEDLCIRLYKKLFSFAEASTSLHLVNNLLPGYLGLMKFEKKKELSGHFNTTASVSMCRKAMSQGFFPKSTSDIIGFMLDRQNESNNN